MSKEVYFIGVDVGSGSVRAALVSDRGHVLNASVKEIQTWKPKVDYYEQSSTDIWDCCVFVIKNVVANINPASIKGIGFDATCSLVALDKNGKPLSVSTNNNEQNIIMWMDHRAQAEADFINKTNHDILKYVGGKVSLEMEMPKLLWLKKHLPNKWHEFGYFFDLPDFLTWTATGSMSRSLCSLVCKWNYECSVDGKQGWNTGFLRDIGLEDLAADNFKKIGNKILMPGEFCGGLSAEVANILGLKPGAPVATSIIDAHAGGLGMIGTHGEGVDKDMPSRLGLICGTSTCHMAVNKKAVLVQGVWGPYYSAMVPSMWLNEAGQSASGMLLDHIISSHPAGAALLKVMSSGDTRNHLRGLLSKMARLEGYNDVSYLTRDVHVWPDFHGNRSPLADPSMRGMICGLSINNSEGNLALLYLATLQALSYGTRHIIEALVLAGYEPFKSLLVCGGITKDPLFVQIQADAVGLPILRPHEKDSVLVGSAILGACASKYFNNVQDAIENMGGTADVIPPNMSTKAYHDKNTRNHLRGILSKMARLEGYNDVSYLTRDVHVWPDFHGNRSPLADPSMRGMICGLSINNSEGNLALLYLATLQALSYGTRHIIEALVLAGYEPFKSLLVCGGITKDPLFVQIQADAVGLPILRPHEKDSVLVGSAILGACASKYFNNVQDAIENMGGTADVIPPNMSTKAYHDKKYRVFLRMFQDQLKYKTVMSSNL